MNIMPLTQFWSIRRVISPESKIDLKQIINIFSENRIWKSSMET